MITNGNANNAFCLIYMFTFLSMRQKKYICQMFHGGTMHSTKWVQRVSKLSIYRELNN